MHTTHTIARAVMTGAVLGLGISIFETVRDTTRERAKTRRLQLIDDVMDYAEVVARNTVERELGLERLRLDIEKMPEEAPEPLVIPELAPGTCEVGYDIDVPHIVCGLDWGHAGDHEWHSTTQKS
jgi:hypothetical protein